VFVLSDQRRPEPIERFRGQGPCPRRGDGQGGRAPIRPPAFAIVAIATSVLAPDIAFADSVIDAGIKPYFVLGGWLAALLFLSIGFFLLSKAIKNRRMAAAVERWPAADGTVISTDIIKRVSKSEDEFDSYIPQVRYSYTASGVLCKGDVIRIGLGDMGYISEKQARDHLARYPVGATISVRYDPQNPQAAALETGQVGAGRKMFAGVLLAGVGIAAIVFAVWIASLPVR